MAGVADQLPLRGQGPLQRVQHRVERRGQPPELVSAIHLDPAGRVAGRGHLLRDRGQPAYRRQAGPRHAPAGQRRQGDSDGAQQGQGRPDAGHLRIHRVERRGHLQGQARRERRGEDHGADPAQRGLAVVRAALLSGDLDRGRVRRQQPAIGRRCPDGTTGRHHLLVRTGRTEPVRMRRNPSGRDVPVIALDLPVDGDALSPQLLAHLVLQVRADHQERHGGDHQRDRGDRGGHGEGEPGPQHERAAGPAPGRPKPVPPGHGAARST